jgi:hypothetical protein
MMKRRTFLKLTGIAMTGQALGAASLAGSPVIPLGAAQPASAAVLPSITSTRRLQIAEPGYYQISGFVRLQAPVVKIGGISNSQQMSWSNMQGPAPVVSFTSMETFSQAGATSEVHVLGGQLESLTATPVLLS